jgi:hypothetical protein
MISKRPVRASVLWVASVLVIAGAVVFTRVAGHSTFASLLAVVWMCVVVFPTVMLWRE